MAATWARRFSWFWASCCSACPSGSPPAPLASNFSAAYRYTGSALTSDFAWLFGAGFAPLVALILASRFGLIAAGAYLLSGAICTLVALTVSRQLEMQEP